MKTPLPETLDRAIDALYTRPLAEFTAARNALAKSAGSRRNDVQKLGKPVAAAWAVNQIYWRERPLFDLLAKSSVALRTAHVRHVNGRPSDLAAAEARHRDALRDAQRAASAFLTEAGASSPAALLAVERTLAAVPAPEIAGRLVKPIDPVGFGLLSTLMEAADRTRSTLAPADVISIDRGPRASAPASRPAVSRQTTRAAAAERARTVRRIDRELADAIRADRAAASALSAAIRTVEHADARVDQLEQDLRRAREAASSARDRVEVTRAAANDAAAARIASERRRREFL